MKLKLLLLALFGTLYLGAQKTHHIDWNLNPTGTSITIEIGDTVTWTWGDALSHSVLRTGGSSIDDFDSGIMNGMGLTYSYTFNNLGTNDYVCGIHAGMTGTITVENNLGIEDLKLDAFSISPNPGTEKLNISLNTNQLNALVEIYDVLGKRIYMGKSNSLNPSINISNWESGLYLVRVSTDSHFQTKRFLKQ